MRTTITLDSDVEALVRGLMRDRGLTFKQAVNEAIRRGLGPQPSGGRHRTATFRMGSEPAVPIDKALRLAGELEDDELVRRLSVRK